MPLPLIAWNHPVNTFYLLSCIHKSSSTFELGLHPRSAPCFAQQSRDPSSLRTESISTCTSYFSLSPVLLGSDLLSMLRMTYGTRSTFPTFPWGIRLTAAVQNNGVINAGTVVLSNSPGMETKPMKRIGPTCTFPERVSAAHSWSGELQTCSVFSLGRHQNAGSVCPKPETTTYCVCVCCKLLRKMARGVLFRCLTPYIFIVCVYCMYVIYIFSYQYFSSVRCSISKMLGRKS